MNHLRVIGTRGKGKSRTSKIIKRISIPNIYISQITLFSPKALATNHNFNNYGVYLFDEVPSVFNQDGNNSRDNGDNGFFQVMKTLMSDDRFCYTFFHWEVREMFGKGATNRRKNTTANRMQVNSYQHSRNGYAFNSNDLPNDKFDPMNDRIHSHILLTDKENIINEMSQTEELLPLDPHLQKKKNQFENMKRLEQVVIYSYLIFCSIGMYGDNMPFTTYITDLLSKNVLSEFSKTFKTYIYGPRDIKRLSNSVLHSMLQRIFAELFLVENSKYKFGDVYGFIFDESLEKDIEEINEIGELETFRVEDHRRPKIEEICYEIHKRAYTTINDF